MTCKKSEEERNRLVLRERELEDEKNALQSDLMKLKFEVMIFFFFSSASRDFSNICFFFFSRLDWRSVQSKNVDRREEKSSSEGCGGDFGKMHRFGRQSRKGRSNNQRSHPQIGTRNDRGEEERRECKKKGRK